MAEDDQQTERGIQHIRDHMLNPYFFTGTSSPSKFIVNLFPTLNPTLVASRYLFTLTMYWLWLNLDK
jgi:hypothetical protein